MFEDQSIFPLVIIFPILFTISLEMVMMLREIDVGLLLCRSMIYALPNTLSFTPSVAGEQILEALENGVSQWPKLEGRFPQVCMYLVTHLVFA